MAAILRALAQTRSSCNSIIRVKQPVAHLHTTRTFHIKDSLKDRNSINTESNEYSKSGSDEAAAQKDTAFKTGESTPEAEMGSQEKSQRDPLNVSPGNPEVSKPLEPGQGGAQKSSSDSAGEGRSSGKGSPAKGKTGERRSSGKGSPAKEKKIT